MREWFNSTFRDGEGRLKPVGGVGAFLVFLTLVVVLIELWVGGNWVIYSAWLVTLGYAAGERRQAAPSTRVESVAPPYIPER